MKLRTICTLAIGLFLLLIWMPSTGSAVDVLVSVETAYQHYTDGEIGRGNGPQVKVKTGINSVYVWGSWEELEIQPRHVTFGPTQLSGAGVGAQYWWFFAEIGYYWPDSETTGTWRHNRDGTYEGKWEVLAETQSADLGPTFVIPPEFDPITPQMWPMYDYTIEGAWGGSIGVQAPLYSRGGWTVGIGAAYRLLKLEDCINGYAGKDPEGEYIGYWQTKQIRDVSTVSVFLGVAYRF